MDAILIVDDNVTIENLEHEVLERAGSPAGEVCTCGDLTANLATHAVAAGGVPVLAHPMQYHYPEPELIELIETAKALGIRALEAYYSEFSAEQTAWLLRAAEKYGMGVSGGSDYHGTRKTHISMGTGCGNLAIPYSVLEELKKLR